MYLSRTVDFRVFNGYVIFSSLDNVYVKLFVHETGLQVGQIVRPREGFAGWINYKITL